MPRFKAMRLGLSVLFIAGVGLCVPCTDFPYAKLENVIHSNLGGHGPDTGKEGLFFSVSLQNVGDNSVTAAEFHVHADAGYVPDLNTWNGLNGEWGRINFHAGLSPSFTAYFVKTGTDTKLPLSRGYLSFSDVDGGPQGKEFVAVSPFFGYYYAVDQTWLTMDTTSNKDFGITSSYTDQEVDIGADNPASGDKLDPTQKQKTITFQADFPSGFADIKFKLGATPGTSSRTIQFNLQATLLCAKTLMPGGTELEPTDLTPGHVFTRVFQGSGGSGDYGPLKTSDFNSKYDICTLSDCDNSIVGQ